MKLYQKILFTILILFTGYISSAQGSERGTLNGTLLDQEEVTIPFATVAVMKAPDSTIVSGSTTDIDGNFDLKAPKPGDYFLRFSAIGYTSSYSSRFKVEEPGFSRDFGAIIMKQETTMLNEVLVESWRPQVHMEGGNMEVRVEGTALAAGSTAFDILSRSPGVTVDQDGNFQLNGKKGVAIMIDGRVSYLSSSELQTLLQGMSAENIESIEIINNPGAKYDAEGSAGILNINLKKNSLTGFNGSIYAGYKYNEVHGYNFGANLNFKKGKWNSFLNLDVNRDPRIRDVYITRGFSAEGNQTAFLEQTGDEVRRRIIPSINLGTDYEINENHSIGIMANLSYQRSENEWNSLGTVEDFENDQEILIDSRNTVEEDFGNGRLNLHYTGKLDTLGTSLSADLDYVRLGRESDANFINKYMFLSDNNNEETEFLSSTSLSDFEIYSARVDLSLPLSERSGMEFGLKASNVVSDSELRFFIEEDNEDVFDPSRSNEFTYEERIYAAYASFNSKLNDTWNLTAGLRAEKTVADGTSPEQLTGRDYLELFPNFRLEQKVSDNYKLNYSYNRRILRPEYKYLNPFIFYTDPYTYIAGNPFLKHQITNSIQLTQTIHKKYNVILGYEFAKDYIGEIPVQDPETKETAFAVRNMDQFRNYSATVLAPVQILPDWNTTNTLVMAHQEYEIKVNEENISRSQLFYMLQSNHRVNLPMDLSLEMNARYIGPLVYGLYDIEDQFGLDAGIKKSFLDDRLDVTLRMDDIFKTMTMEGSSDVQGNTTFVKQYRGQRTISLNLRYNLSGDKTVSQKHQSDLEELKRAGGK